MFAFFYEALRQGPWGTVQDYQLLGGPWGFALREITKEVHLWQGDEDHIVPLCQARWLSERLPAARLHIVPGQGHFLLRPRLNEVLSVLLKDQAPTAPLRVSVQHAVSCGVPLAR
jgi:pimeloyl-ACP methyl ester carboxylesterase